MTDHGMSSAATQPPDWEALARYHAGESPAAEAQAVAAWLAAHPRDAALLAALDEALEGAMAVGHDAAAARIVDIEAALRAVRGRREPAVAAVAAPVASPHATASAPAGVLPIWARLTPGVVRPVPAPERTVVRRRRTWRVAGGLAAVAAAIALLVARPREAVEGTAGASAVLAAGGGASLVTPGRTVETAVGVRDSLRLPDGTRVVLAPGSRLTVPESFGEAAREVTLEGHAHFTATHDEVRPFTVRTATALVRDLGTVFTVHTHGALVDGDAAGVVVAVTAGRVALGAGDAAGSDRDGPSRDTGVVLEAGDRGTLDARGTATAERDVVTADEVAWTTRGALVYRATPLSVVAADLRRWYGIELRVPDRALAARRLTATFAGEPVDQVLAVIALALDARVERSGHVATLRPAGGARR
jgi:transmembrane sensor